MGYRKWIPRHVLSKGAIGIEAMQPKGLKQYMTTRQWKGYKNSQIRRETNNKLSYISNLVISYVKQRRTVDKVL